MLRVSKKAPNSGKKRSKSRQPSRTLSPTRRLNDLDGSTWAKFSLSVWAISKSKSERTLHHPAIFPLELCQRLVRMFSMPKDLIIDPFCGSGTTLVAAHELGRRGVGLDINPQFVDMSNRRLTQTSLLEDRERASAYRDEGKNLLKYLEPGTAQLCITSPPYWNIHTRKRSADYKTPRPYSSLEGDIGNISDYSEFLNQLKEILGVVFKAIRVGGYCAVIVMDIRVLDKFIPFHIDVSTIMESVGFKFSDVIIWDRTKEYNNLRTLGYPYKFIVNKVHEYILVFQKSRGE